MVLLNQFGVPVVDGVAAAWREASASAGDDDHNDASAGDDHNDDDDTAGEGHLVGEDTPQEAGDTAAPEHKQ